MQPSPGQVGTEQEADLGLDPGQQVASGVDGQVLARLHVVEQMAVVGLVDAHHVLHGLRRKADLVPDDAPPGVQTPPDVDQLDAVGVVDVEAGVGAGQRRDRGPAVLGGLQRGGGPRLLLGGQHRPASQN